MPQLLIIRPAAELDLGHERRLDPHHIRIAMVHGRLAYDERPQLSEQVRCGAIIEPCADTSNLDQVIAAASCQFNASQAAERGRRTDEADNGETVGQDALDLQPLHAAA